MDVKYYQVFRMWNFVVVLVSLYVAIVIPINIVFNYFPIEEVISNRLITFVFIADFFVNAVRKKKCAEIREFYTRPWFLKVMNLTDLVAAIPFVMFISVPAISLLRLFKLVRIYDIMQTTRGYLFQFANTFIFLTFVFWSIIALNGLACGWYSLRGESINPNFADNYINSLYWVTTTLTTVGYGDVLPITNGQKIYAIFVEILGFGVFGFMIGSVASRLMRRDPAKARYQENMEGLESLVHYRSLPKCLRNRIVAFYKYMWKRRLGYDESVFLQSLPENLQTEVALYLKKDVIEKVSIFKNASGELRRELALHLKPLFLTPGDYAFKTGDKGTKMYFVIAGELETLTPSEDRVLTTLKSGDFFGEIALFKNDTRSATIKALTYCDIYTLGKKSFDKVTLRYPDIAEKIREKIESRESRYSNE